MPEELKQLLRDALTDVSGLSGEVRDLRERYEASQTSLREARRRQKRANIIRGLFIALALVGVAAVGYAIDTTNSAVDQINQERADRRNEIVRQIDTLACLIIGGTPDDPARPIIHNVRVQYHCPAYDPNAAKKYGPTATRTATATKTMHAPGPTVTVPGATPTPETVFRTRTVNVPDATRTVTRHSTRTVTKTRTVVVPVPTCVRLPIIPPKC